jgi:hypothetical protein
MKNTPPGGSADGKFKKAVRNRHSSACSASNFVSILIDEKELEMLRVLIRSNYLHNPQSKASKRRQMKI